MQNGTRGVMVIVVGNGHEFKSMGREKDRESQGNPCCQCDLMMMMKEFIFQE